MRSFSKVGSFITDIVTVLDHDPEEEGLIEVEDKEEPEETDSVLGVQGVHLPVNIPKGVLEESSDVLECSPLLSHITGLSSGDHEFVEIAISLLSEGSIRFEYKYFTYLPIISALSLMLGTPCMRP